MKYFTSHQLGEGEIKQYLGLVTSQYVIGANFFKDFLGGISDIFGGQNDGYKNVLKNLEKAALKELSEKTEALGGNAVIGLTIDQDEVSGGGKSMFMIKVYGTAVLLHANDKNLKSSVTLSEQHYQMVLDHKEAVEYLKTPEGMKLAHHTEEAIKNIKINLFPDNEIFRLFLNTGLSNSIGSTNDYLTQLENIPTEYFMKYIDAILSKEEPIGTYYVERMAQFFKSKSLLPVSEFRHAIEGGVELKVLKYISLLNQNIRGYTFNDTYYQDLNELMVLLEQHQSDLQTIAYEACPHCSKQKMKNGRCRNCNIGEMRIEPIIDGYKEQKEILDTLFANKDRFI